MKKNSFLKGIRSDKPWPFNKHRVYINGKQLSWKRSFKYLQKSISGFEWGYGGAGPQQLAFAILLALTTEDIARKLYYSFTEDFVSKLPTTQNFSVTQELVEKAISRASKNPANYFYTPRDIKQPTRKN